MKRKIVITGIGLITPCGEGWAPYWDAALRGRSSIRKFSGFGDEIFPVPFAGEIPGFNPEEYIKPRKSLKVMSREIQMAVVASHLALRDAGLSVGDFDKTRFGVSLGTGIINTDLDEIAAGIRGGFDEQGRFDMKKFGRDGIRSFYPLWFLKYLPNMPACHISIAHNLLGPSNTVTTSSAAGLQAVGEGFHVIERGDAEIMLAGSTDSKLNAMGISRFHLLGLLSHHREDPGRAYCPFDKRRDGIVVGEGAGLILMEEYEHARSRGARIYGEIAGYGSSSDFNFNPSAKEDYAGKRVAMSRALEDARMDSSEVDLIVANGSGIPEEDVQEALALQSVFGSSLDRKLVTGVKPITGHLIYGAGGVEAAAGVLTLHESVVPPLANLENPDPECDLPFVTEKPRPFESRAILVNAFGFGGQNAALVLKKP